MSSNLSVTRRVQSYLIQRPAIYESLRLGIINYSALARIISKNLGINEEPAIAKALRRIHARLETKKGQSNSLFPKLLAKARLVIRSQMAIVALFRPATAKQLTTLTSFAHTDESEITIVEGHLMTSLIVPEESLRGCHQIFKTRIHSVERDLVKLTLLFDMRVTKLPGFAGYIHGVFGAHRVNIYADATCAGEHVIMIREKDLSTVVQFIRG